MRTTVFVISLEVVGYLDGYGTEISKFNVGNNSRLSSGWCATVLVLYRSLFGWHSIFGLFQFSTFRNNIRSRSK